MNIVKTVGTQLYNVSETVKLIENTKNVCDVQYKISTCNPSKSCKYRRTEVLRSTNNRKFAGVHYDQLKHNATVYGMEYIIMQTYISSPCT